MDENTFWKCTPRKLFSLIACHVEANMSEEDRRQKGIKSRNKPNMQKQNKEVISQVASW